MYIIRKCDSNIVSIDDKIWESVSEAQINCVNWQEYRNIPETTGRLLYNDYGIFVRLETDEKPLLARHTTRNSMVSDDSCMEFFFRPNENDQRYINFEFNPFGTMLLAVRTSRYDPVYPDRDRNYFDVKSVVDEKRWVLQFCIPFEFVDEIFTSHNKTIYGNLYKCGDETQNKHYASLFPITSEKPDFHRPEFFGEFVLE